jgi:hypothetical protein
MVLSAPNTARVPTGLATVENGHTSGKVVIKVA